MPKKNLLLVLSNAVEGKEDEFNDWYSNVHLHDGVKVPGFVAAVRPDGNSVMIVPASLASTDARAMELWIIPPGGRPHSLGLIQPGRPVQLNVPRELIPHMRSDAVLAISLEPPGGSPTGLPTGPVIANGKLTNL